MDLSRLTDDEPAPLDINDLSVFAEEIVAFVERKIAEIPVPQVEFNTKLAALESKLDAVLAIINAQPKTDALMAAIGKLTAAMTAPKTIITDAQASQLE